MAVSRDAANGKSCVHKTNHIYIVGGLSMLMIFHGGRMEHALERHIQHV